MATTSAKHSGTRRHFKANGLKRIERPSSEKHSPKTVTENASGDHETNPEADSNEENTDEEAEEAKEKQNGSQPRAAKIHKFANAAEVRAAREASEAFKSNVFKLQVDEVLKEIAIDEKYAVKARKLLFQIRESIAATSDMGPFDYKSAQQALTTRIPFPQGDRDIKYKFGYAAPQLDSINVIGSWSLHTTLRRPHRSAGIDLLVPMVSSLFENKDYLDFRYHRKRAFFLAALASQLAESTELPVELRFERFNGNEYRPTLQLVPSGPLSKLAKHITIYIHVTPPLDVFPLSKLAPNKTADRSVDGPTPVYNWSVLADVCAMPLLRYQHTAAASAPAYADAVRLGALWLQQRGWASDHSRGGFGAFEFAVLMAALLQGGSKNGKKRLMLGFSSYQLFKGTLLYIAESGEIALTGSLLDPSISTMMSDERGILFTDCGLDVLANMPSWAPRLLRQDSQLAVDMLNDSTRDRFSSLFLRDVSAPHLSFDSHLTVELLEPTNLTKAIDRISSVLHRAWGPRYVAMKVTPVDLPSHGSLDSSWPLSSSAPRYVSQRFFVGVLLDSKKCDKRVTFVGPEVHDNPDEFNEFWGAKSSLRRFQDGSIKYAVSWSLSNGHSVVQEAAQYTLTLHLRAMVQLPKNLENLLPSNGSTDSVAPGAVFAAMHTSFQDLARVLVELRSVLPLRITAVFGTSAALRSASLSEPEPFHPEHAADGIIELESSSQWPRDLQAAEKVKTAFLIKIAESIRKSHPQYFAVIGLEPSIDYPEIESAFATFQTPEGYYFRLQIVSRSNAAPFSSTLIALADHTRMITTMTHRYPSTLSTAMRLVKLWFERQMLMTHISEPAVELLTLSVFVNSAPWAPPVGANTAFWRVLNLLSTWDWQENAMYLDVDKHIIEEDKNENNIEHQKIITGCDMDYNLFQSMTTAFVKQRKQDPALTQAPWVIFTKLDITGIKWTAYEPRTRIAALISSRVTALARAANPQISIFKPALGDFDVAWTVKGPRTSSSKPKNIAISDPYKAIIGAHHIPRNLVEALCKLYQGSLVLFYSGSLDESSANEHTLCAIWNRPALEPIAKLKANVPYPLRKIKEGFKLDQEAVLLEIERLGSGMIKRMK